MCCCLVQVSRGIILRLRLIDRKVRKGNQQVGDGSLGLAIDMYMSLFSKWEAGYPGMYVAQTVAAR